MNCDICKDTGFVHLKDQRLDNIAQCECQRPRPRITKELQAMMRKDYLNNVISHDQYYLWLADAIGFKEQCLLIPAEEILASHDRAMNDIQLHRWDRHQGLGHLHPGCGVSLSLSDCVCIAKAVARKMKRRLQAEAEAFKPKAMPSTPMTDAEMAAQCRTVSEIADIEAKLCREYNVASPEDIP